MVGLLFKISFYEELALSSLYFIRWGCFHVQKPFCWFKHFPSPSPSMDSGSLFSSVSWVVRYMVLTAKWSIMFFTLLAYKYHSSYIKNMPGLIPKLLCIYWNSLILCLLSCVRSSLKFISMSKGAWSLLAAETSTSTFCKLTQVFHTSRINLSPFTKDFRV